MVGLDAIKSCCMLQVVRGMLHVACGMWYLICCMLYVVCCMLYVACGVLYVAVIVYTVWGSTLSSRIVCCMLHVVCGILQASCIRCGARLYRVMWYVVVIVSCHTYE